MKKQKRLVKTLLVCFFILVIGTNGFANPNNPMIEAASPSEITPPMVFPNANPPIPIPMGNEGRGGNKPTISSLTPSLSESYHSGSDSGLSPSDLQTVLQTKRRYNTITKKWESFSLTGKQKENLMLSWVNNRDRVNASIPNHFLVTPNRWNK